MVRALPELARTDAVRSVQRLLKAAQIVYDLNAADLEARVIDEHSAAWHVGDFTVILKVNTNQLFVSGSNWSATVDCSGEAMSLSGLMNGDPDNGSVTIKTREFFALVIASAAIQHRGNDTYDD